MHQFFSDTGTVVKGRSGAIALRSGPRGLFGWHKSAGGPLMAIGSDTGVGTVTPSMTQEVSIGGYHGDRALALGVIAAVVWCVGELEAAQIDRLMLPRAITQANDDQGGPVQAGASVRVAVTANDIFEGDAPTLAVVPPLPARGEASFDGLDLVYAAHAGAETGEDRVRYTVDGSGPGTVSFAVASASAPDPVAGENPELAHNGLWIGQTFFARGAGNYILNGTQWVAYRFRAERTGLIDRIGFNCPRRDGYFRGNGGVMRMTVHASSSPTRLGRELYRHPDITAPQDVFDDGAGWVRYGFGARDLVRLTLPAPIAVTKGEIYFVVWRNVGGNPTNNWYSINNLHHNDSLPEGPYSDAPYYDVWNMMTGNASGFGVRHTWMPFLQLRYTDGVETGTPYLDGGNSTAIVQLGQSSIPSNSSAREIGVNHQSRQRFQLPDGFGATTIDRIDARIWRRTSSTGGVLRITLEREDAGGGVTTLRAVDISPGSVLQTLTESSSTVFPPLRLVIPDTVLQPGTWYRLRAHATGNAVFAMRALGQMPDSTTRTRWLPGRAEYSTDGGTSWRGMHSWGTDDRSDYTWNMGMRVKTR